VTDGNIAFAKRAGRVVAYSFNCNPRICRIRVLLAHLYCSLVGLTNHRPCLFCVNCS